MTNQEKKKQQEEDLIHEMETELEEVETQWEEETTKEEETTEQWENEKNEDENQSDILARTLADFDNFKKRVERDKQDMVFFIKQDILTKILPRIDDIERIIKNTPDEMQNGALYEWLLAMEKKLEKDLESLGVESFISVGNIVDPNIHDVMTTVPGWKEWIIIDEFEKWYKIGEKILRPAKVVVGAGS